MEGKQPLVSVISPVFIRIRTDKKANSQDAGLSQITKIIAIDKKNIEKAELKKSEILSRSIYERK